MRKRTDGWARAWIVAAAFIVGGIALAENARAGSDVILVPIAWCAHQGSNAASGATPIPQPYPNTPPDTNTDGILWRRHERVTDQIYQPQGAKLTFRSGVINPLDPNDPISFPVITDNTTGTNRGDLGDVAEGTIFGAGADLTEARKVWNQCRQAWVDTFNRSDGIHAVNINRFVDANGNDTSLGGRFGSTIGGAYMGGGLVVDNTTSTFTFNSTPIPFFHTDPADQLVGHELGHSLGLAHRTDDPLALMQPSGHSTSLGATFPHFRVDNLKLNGSEITTVRGIAKTVPGMEVDPPGVFTPGDVVGTLAFDQTEEHDTQAHLDLTALHAALNQVENQVTFGAELFAPFPGDTSADYWILVNTDGNPETGGDPADLAIIGGPSTAFRGAELAIEAHVGGTCDGPCEPARGTVWKFGCSGEIPSCSFDPLPADSFVFSLPAMIWYDDPLAGTCAVCAEIIRNVFHTVTVSIDNELVGLRLGSPFLIQAFAIDGGVQLDALDETPEETGKAFMLSLPDFAHCFPQSDGIAGRTVPVGLEGLLPSRPIHGLLGPRLVFTGTTDATGGGTINLPIPGDTTGGLHLVTVGVDDSAFTADCTVNVIPNAAPDCSQAVASPALVRSAGKKFQPISIGGVADPEGEPVSVVVTSIRQDEPIGKARGIPETCPDGAGIGTDTALVRAERIGTPANPGDGRVYQINFEATDDLGAACQGSVTVCVPHDASSPTECVDQGALIDSTGPCS